MVLRKLVQGQKETGHQTVRTCPHDTWLPFQEDSESRSQLDCISWPELLHIARRTLSLSSLQLREKELF